MIHGPPFPRNLGARGSAEARSVHGGHSGNIKQYQYLGLARLLAVNTFPVTRFTATPATGGLAILLFRDGQAAASEMGL